DRLALAVRVAGQEHPAGPVGLPLDLAEDVAGAAAAAALGVVVGLLVDGVPELPPVGDADAGDLLALLLAGGQVADVAVAGEHLEVRPEVLVDRLRLGRRLDDQQVEAAAAAGRAVAVAAGRGPLAAGGRRLDAGVGGLRGGALAGGLLGFGRGAARRFLAWRGHREELRGRVGSRR